MAKTLDEDFILPLFVSLGTIIDEKYVKAAYKEAAEYPSASREHRAFINYAKSLQKRLDKQKEFDKK